MAQTFVAPLTTSLVPAYAAGSSTPTFTRATTASTIDFEGMVRRVLSGEARFYGARRVRNWVDDSDPNDASWIAAGDYVKTGLQSDPWGGTKAIRCDAPTGEVGGALFQIPATLPGATQQGVISMWLRGAAGGEIATFSCDGVNGPDVTLTTSWRRYADVPRLAPTSVTIGVRGVSAQSFYVAGIQIENAEGQSNQAPAELVSVGELSTPWHGAGVDGVKYFPTTNGNRANMLADSEDFSAASWAAFIQGATVTANATTAPDGTLTADKIAEDGGNNEHRIGCSLVGKAVGYARRFSFYAKAAERNFARTWGAPSADQTIFDLVNGTIDTSGVGNTPTMESVGNGWWRCSVNIPTGNDVALVLGPNDDGVVSGVLYPGTLGSGIYVWGAMLETGSTTRSYIKSGNMIEAAGTPIADATLRGYWGEPAATNRCLRSEEFDSATWVKTNVTVAPNSTIAPDGTRTADTLTATAANGTCIQDLGVVASAIKTGGLWLKRLTGTGAIQLTLDGGATAASVTVTTSWGRVDLTSVLADEDFGIRIVVSGDAVYAWGAQVETDPAGYGNNSSYIPTTTPSVTRNADIFNYPSTSNGPAAAGTIYAEYQSNGATAAISENMVTFSGAAYGAPSGLLVRATSAVQLDVGGNSSAAAVGLPTGSWVTGIRRVAGTYRLSNTSMQAFAEGAASALALTLDFTGVGTTVINIGSLDPTGNQHSFGTIRNVRIWNTVMPFWLLDGGGISVAEDGSRWYVVNVNGSVDAGAFPETIIVDPATFTDIDPSNLGTSPINVAIDSLAWSVQDGITVRLQWEATTDVDAYAMVNTDAKRFDMPILNNAGAGKTNRLIMNITRTNPADTAFKYFAFQLRCLKMHS